KFSSRFTGDGGKPKTFASFATFADGGQIFEPQPNTDKGASDTPEIQSVPVKVAQVAKVEPEPAEPSAGYEATEAGAEGTCHVQIIELPRAQRYRKTFAHLQTKCPALVPVERWRQCIKDGSKFLVRWGERAQALGWTSADLFRLHTPPDK